MTEKIYMDESGKPYVLDEKGNRRPPMQLLEPLPEDHSGWKVYDTSQGHCALCGRLTCSGYGECFK